MFDSRLEYAAPARLTLNGTALGFTESLSGADAEGKGGALTVSLNEAARIALAAAANQIISLEVDTIVHGTGDIPNEATVYINEPASGVGTGTNTVNTYWGAVSILKHATGNTAAVLKDASFSVYPTEADALASTNAIEVEGETEFTTAANGTVVIPGLWAGATATSTMTYWLVETVAPAGYVLNDAPIAVVVNAGALTQPVSISVPNAQESQLNLPLTGGAGTAVMVFGGSALLLAASGLALFSLRRKRESATTID